MFSKILDNNISPNQFYLLICINNNTKPSPLINIALERRQLTIAGLIDGNIITPKGKKIILEIGIKEVNNKDIIVNNQDEIDRYINLWPRIKLPSGYTARSSRSNLISLFKWFFDNHVYNWETIYKATEVYLRKQELMGWTTCRTSKYFVRKKLEGSFHSDLADYCYNVENGLEEDNYPTITEKIV